MLKKLDALLAKTLVDKELLSRSDSESFLKEAASGNENLFQLLSRRGIVQERSLLAVLAEGVGGRFLDIRSISVEKRVLDKVPVKIAVYYNFMPLEIRERVLTIAVSYPLDIKTQDEIGTQLGFEIETVLSPRADIADTLKKHYGLAAETLDTIVSQTSKTEVSRETTAQPRETVEDIEKLSEDASVTQLVNQIILEGWRKRATDIHIESYRQGVALRYRIDGLLYEAPVPPEIKSYVNAMISRIKIMSNLNIVERRLPQDGRAIVRVQDQMLDLRISTVPTPFGENMVIRILPTQMLFSLERLGLAKRDLQIFEQLVQKPHGIIFVTGPTGSGKTTTLYACLSRINTAERKIITIEDPIEYEMAGITQIQVNADIGLDFAKGLRSILRHDPDVIMVGEVRDLETAETAIRVALTGHLVFSTLHTNDAASGIARLLDIGEEPYLLSSSVEAFIAQRLIRVICLECKVEVTSVPVELKEMIARDLGLRSREEVKIYKGKGCSSCNFTGFFGRTAIYEILLVDESIKSLIVKKATSSEIKRAALLHGMRTLRQDGWQKTIAGVTTPEEVMKVTSAEDETLPQRRTGASFVPVPQIPLRSAEEPSESSEEAEKRVYQRLNAKVNIRYKTFRSLQDLAKAGFTPEYLSVTRNISAGGLLFVADEAFPAGSILELFIELPHGEHPIECLSRVERVDEIEKGKSYGIGVCFLDVTSADKTRLNRYVESGLNHG